MAIAQQPPAQSPQQQYAEDWAELESLMQQGVDHAETWTYSWLGIYGASAVTGVVLATTSGSSTERYNARVRAVTSSLGFLDVLQNPMPHQAGYEEFQALRHHNTDQALSLERARGLARELARREQVRQASGERLGGLIVNTAAGLVIGIGDKRPADGLATALTGMAVTEANIRTRPQTLSRASGITMRFGQTPVQVYPHFAAAPGQVAFNLRF